MPISRFVPLLLALCLGACTSSPAAINYYMLHSPQAKQHKQPDTGPQVVLSDVQLPDYLMQRQLALQTSDTTLHFASQHVWSSPQDEDIRRLLSSGLRHDGVAVFTPATNNVVGDVTKVTISIDDFIPTWQGELILKGEYVIEHPDDSSNLTTFDYRTTLTQDGFAHSVVKMRELLARLSQQLSNDLKQ